MAIRVRFDDPDNGSIGISIEQRDSSFAESFSYVPYDSLQELVLALGRVLASDTTTSATCLVGAPEFDLHFERSDNIVRFTVVEFADYRRQKGAGKTAFLASGSFEQICVPFWRALRELESRFSSEDFAGRWHREFPHDELRRLTERIRSQSP